MNPTTAGKGLIDPSGISHAPKEHVDDGDCQAGTDALVACLQELL